VKSVVVDASVAVCWFAREAGSPAANRLIRKDVMMIAPSLILLELGNAVWKIWRRGQIDETQTEIAIREVNRFIPEIVEMAKFISPALALARETGHSIYDCVYFALARQRNLKLVTLDRKLVTAFAGLRDADRAAPLDDWLQTPRHREPRRRVAVARDIGPA